MPPILLDFRGLSLAGGDGAWRESGTCPDVGLLGTMPVVAGTRLVAGDGGGQPEMPSPGGRGDSPPAGVLHLKDAGKGKGEPRNADVVTQPRWCVVGITPDGVYGLGKDK
jgi:hypothetical protein